MLNELRWRKAIVVSGVAHVAVLGCIGYTVKEVFVPEQQQNYMNVVLIDESAAEVSISTAAELEPLNGSRNSSAFNAAMKKETDFPKIPISEKTNEEAVIPEDSVTVFSPEKFLEADFSPSTEDFEEAPLKQEDLNLQAEEAERAIDEFVGRLHEPVQTEAKILYAPAPQYPSILKEEGKQGCVTIRILILKDGLVGAAQVLQPSGEPLLDEAALEAARAWRFEPAVGTEGQAVESLRVIPFDFY